MAIRNQFGLTAHIVFVSAVVSLAAAGLSEIRSAAAPEADTPPEVRKGIEVVLKAKVSSLLAEKNDQGSPYKRGYYSRTFRRLDDTTYQVAFKADTALEENLVAERHVLTLKQGADGSWAIEKDDLQDTYKGLYRGKPGDQECFNFDSLSLEREGLMVKASKGSVCKDFFNGKLQFLTAAAADLAYEYKPPVPKEAMTFHMLKKEREADLVFDPDHVLITCDPVSCERFLPAFTNLQPIKLDQTDPPVQKAYEKSTKDREKNLKDNPFFGFRRPYDPDRRFYTIGIRKKSLDEEYFALVHDSYEGKEISVWAPGFFLPIHRYHSEETRKSGVSPDELDMRPDAEARDFDLTSLKGSVEMGFGDGETLVGDVTYGLKTKRELQEIPFGIARIFQTEEKKETKNPRMTINSLQDGEGNEMTWVRTGLYSGLVVLPKPVPPGTPLTLRLQFENKDSLYKLTPTYTYVDRGGWLPFVRFADMINEFDLTVKVPMKYKTLGIGRMVSEVKKDGASITRWVSDSPVSFPTVIFGDYEIQPAKVKAKKLDGTEIPVTMYFDKDSMGRYGILPRALTKFADDAANALNLYATIFQVDYPFAKLDLVNDPVLAFYGQAPSSLIYLGSASFWSTGFTSGLLEGGADLSKFRDSLVAHETAHQWWGALISNANDRNYWFVESLAEYSAALFIENVYGKKAYQEHVDAWRRNILETDSRASVQDGYTVWQGPGGGRNYQTALYSKGPYAFHIMRSTWGDEAFFKFLKTLVADLKGKEITTRQIQRVAEKSFGANLNWFFDQWLRGVGLPEFTFTYKVREAEDGSQVIEGQIDQRILMKPASAVKEPLEGQYFQGIVPITIIGKSGKEYRKKLIIEGPKTAFKFSIPEKPKEIVFNKYGESLAYDVKVIEGS